MTTSFASSSNNSASVARDYDNNNDDHKDDEAPLVATSSSSSPEASSTTTTEKPASSTSVLLPFVHQATRNGDWSALQSLMKKDDFASTTSSLLLWEPNAASGWTAVHYAVSHLDWSTWQLEWILQQAATPSQSVTETAWCAGYCLPLKSATSPFFRVHTALGQSVFDIFFRSYLDPLPWQCPNIKARAKQLQDDLRNIVVGHEKDAASTANNNKSVLLELQAIQIGLEQVIGGAAGNSKTMDDTTATNNSGGNIDDGERPAATNNSASLAPASRVERIVHFLYRLFLLARAAIVAGQHTSTATDHQQQWHHHHDDHQKQWLSSWDGWMDLLARTGSCPDEVAGLIRMLLQQSRRRGSASSLPQKKKAGDVYQCCCCCFADDSSSSCLVVMLPSPLHTWAVSSTNYPERDGMLPHLLAAYPDAPLQPAMFSTRDGATTGATKNAIAATDGWLPLQLALAYGKSWTRVQPLLLHAPVALLQPVPPPSAPPPAGGNHHHHHDTSLVLPLVAWAALAPLPTSTVVRARQETAGRKHGLVSLWLPGNKRKAALQQAATELDCERLTTLFELLLVHPRALDEARFEEHAY